MPLIERHLATARGVVSVVALNGNLSECQLTMASGDVVVL